MLEDIRNSSSFEVPLAKDVYWVSYNILGKPKLAYNDIISLIHRSPEIKQCHIETIPDAITLFVLSDFQDANDNMYIEEDGIIWEHCKPGRVAVESNEGCCASCATWTNYLLAHCFEKSGYLSVIRPTNGHVFNFFVREGWYYFLDMQNFVRAYRSGICRQTGCRVDFASSRFLTSAMVKAASLEAYIRYYKRYVSRVVPEHLFIVHERETICPVGIKKTVLEKKCICLQKEETTLAFEDPEYKYIQYEMNEKYKPLKYPEW